MEKYIFLGLFHYLFFYLLMRRKEWILKKYIPIASVIVYSFAVVIHYKQYWNVGSEC